MARIRRMDNVEAKVRAVILEVELNAPENTMFPTQWLVEFFAKSRTAGRAKGICTIEINTDLAEKYPDQLRDTVIHEMAHCLVHLNYDYRCKPHGHEWQDMMHRLGVVPERCHRMEQPNLKVNRHGKHKYRCGCRDHYLKTGRHNKHIVYGMTFTCRGCGTELEYVEHE